MKLLERGSLVEVAYKCKLKKGLFLEFNVHYGQQDGGDGDSYLMAVVQTEDGVIWVDAECMTVVE